MSQKFKITFMPMNVSVEVDPAAAPFTRMGEPGSILDIVGLSEQGVYLEHVCGGVCACATCHVKVREGAEACNPRSEDELDMLEMADDVEDCSRLGCQTVPNGQGDIVVEIPDDGF